MDTDHTLVAVELRSWKRVGLLALVTLILAVLATCHAGCTTVSPAPVAAHQVSWDGTAQHSGIPRMDAELGGFVVTARFVERYDALIAVYGSATDSLTGLPYFTPALTLRYGLSQSPAGEYVMSPEAMAYFVRMNQWRRSGRQPR